MQNTLYAEVQMDDQGEARAREQTALANSIELMQRAQLPGATSTDAVKAIVFTRKLWIVLIEDLSDPKNGLPKELRGSLVSIGIWILRELDAVAAEPQRGFADLIAVSTPIRDGLL